MVVSVRKVTVRLEKAVVFTKTYALEERKFKDGLFKVSFFSVKSRLYKN